MKCNRVRPMLSSYLDGVVTGHQMRAVSDHLEVCPSCSREYEQLQQTQQMVASLGPARAPADLALRLRVAISHEASLRAQHRWEVLLLRLEDAVNGFMLPATAGVVSAVVFFGLMIGFFALPGQLSASSDVPTMLYTPPQLEAVPVDVGLTTGNSDSVVVETLVGADGRVQDYRIISAPTDHHKLRPQLNNIMIFTTFRPATSFGVPTSGRVVLSFSKINVKG